MKVDVEYRNSLDMKFVLIPPGEFMMGSTPEEIDAAIKEFLPDNVFWNTWVKSEGPRHKVILTQPFYLGMHEVTQKQYESITGTNPSWFAKSGAPNDILKTRPDFNTPNYPVENVSWNDAAEYCAKLSQREQMQPCYERSGEKVALKAGNGYRLATEAQWEFACRAGTTTRFSCGDGADQLLRTAWFEANSEGGPHPVGTLSPNALGLYDMHGNVMEWCQDALQESYFDQFAAKIAIDPAGGPSTTSERMVRGGAWPRPATVLRAPHRFASGPHYRHGAFGIRLVLSVDAVRQASSRVFANSLGMQFALVPKGKGLLGGGGGNPGKEDVEFRDDFFLGMYEVTWEEWEKVTGKHPRELPAVEGISPEELKRFPAGGLCWEEARQFIDSLNEKVKEPGWVYRLPTQVEWEYACRGGPVDSLASAFDFYAGRPSLELLPTQANFAQESREKQSCQVGRYSPNKLGLYDMHGNVWEFCDDVLEGQGVITQAMCGGSSDLESVFCRASYCYGTGAKIQNRSHGLRVARVRR